MKQERPSTIEREQRELCNKYNADLSVPKNFCKLGISEAALTGALPIHGLRHLPAGEECGWYIWSGDYSDDPEFFKPLHIEHAFSDRAIYAKYLALPPGWRFLIGEDGYEDVWFDPSLLEGELG